MSSSEPGKDTLLRGFGDQTLDATACFRTVLEAMARPARPVPLPVTPPAPKGLNAGTVAVLLTLADFETPIWLGPGTSSTEARQHLTFHTGSPLTPAPDTAAFAVISHADDPMVLDDLPLGTDDYPDRSATVICQVDALTPEAGDAFSGPGIETRHRLEIAGLADSLWQRIDANTWLFPRGLDWLFTTATHVAALPRTTRRHSETTAVDARET